jgi:hypothetical protein
MSPNRGEYSLNSREIHVTTHFYTLGNVTTIDSAYRQTEGVHFPAGGRVRMSSLRRRQRGGI